MSRDKQIEEMAKELYGYSIDTEEDSEYVATILYTKGYRKSSEVAREIFEEILNILSRKYEAVTTDCHYNLRYGNVDTPEGRRDLGKAEMLKYLGDKIAELKKKYIGEDTNVRTNKEEGE